MSPKPEQVSLGGSSLAPFIEWGFSLSASSGNAQKPVPHVRRFFSAARSVAAPIGLCQLFRPFIQTPPSAPALAVAGPQCSAQDELFCL